MGLLTPLVFTIVTIGLFGISTAPMVDDVFAEHDKEWGYNGPVPVGILEDKPGEEKPVPGKPGEEKPK